MGLIHCFLLCLACCLSGFYHDSSIGAACVLKVRVSWAISHVWVFMNGEALLPVSCLLSRCNFKCFLFT